MRQIVYSAMFNGKPFPFEGLGVKSEVVRDPSQLIETDSVLVIWGGADINPALYGHKKGRYTHCIESRDMAEWGLIKEAVRMEIPIIGVCRGAQMLCAAAGGFLIQDVVNHSGMHYIKTFNGKTIEVNSVHHQMMAGYENIQHELLGWTAPALSTNQYVYKNDLHYRPPEGFVEAEIIYFPQIKGLAVQWHPEAMSEDSDATKFILEQFNLRHGVKDDCTI